MNTVSLPRIGLGGLGLCLVLAGCQSTPSQSMVQPTPLAQPMQHIQPPEWTLNPTPSSGFGGVGTAMPHVDGRAAQRQLAISRAINEIARQMGVEVSSILETREQASQNTASASIEAYSIQTTRGQVVTAHIRGAWQHPESQELFIWMTTQ